MALLEKSEIHEKGFFSIDALFAIILLLLITSTLINLYQGRTQIAEDSRAKIEGRMISEKLAGAINVVYASGDSLSLNNIQLPDNILGNDYSIKFDAETRKIFIEIKGSASMKSTRASVVTEKVNISDFLDTSQKIKVYRKGNEIRVKNL